jgi:phosphatidylglycerol:prolipoprotein diacylglycerol transferase
MSAFFKGIFMIPNIDFFGKTISIYMIISLIGVLTVLLFTYKLAKKHKLDEFHMLYMMLFAFLGVVFGGHILYAITNIKYIIKLCCDLSVIKSFDDFINNVIYIFGGSVFYGGLIGGLSASFLYMKKKKINYGEYSDVASMAIPLFHTFGRIGCFLSGCCYGVEWKYGFVYHYSVAQGANDVPRFPVQLVEAILNFALFILMYILFKKGKCKHRLLLLYLLIYPVYRFVLEFFRGDDYRGFLLGLSTSQLISIVIFVVALLSLILLQRKVKLKSDTYD